MEHLPPRSPDEEPHGPDHDRLWPGEIDLTGATRQDEALADVIGDAIGEAESGGSEVPEWGARTLARSLANERDDPLTGALHHFAVTGRADREVMFEELTELYQATTDEQIQEWINWLGTYIVRLPDQPAPTEHAGPPDRTTPDLTTTPEAFGAHLRHAFAHADARGEVITAQTARDLAAFLALFLDPTSQMARFADTGDANPVLLSQECQNLRRLTDQVPGADGWITRFEQHLASHTDLGRPAPSPPAAPSPAPEASAEPDNPQIAEGRREHGAAFDAFLTLPDIDTKQTDLLDTFRISYVGSYHTMQTLVHDLTDGTLSSDERARWAAEGVSLDDLVRACWDIVELGGTFYVFSH